MRRFTGWLAVLVVAGCGGGSNHKDSGDAMVSDPGTDITPEPSPEVAPDILSDDTAGDDGATDAKEPPACETPAQGRLDPPLPDPQKFALAVFHFNIQYVAGGLKGLMPSDLDPEGTFDLGNDALEDRIVTESFEPLLDLFLDHPTFAADIELQGYMLDVMMDRHPHVVDKMRTLVARGQIAVQSFHYSDQLFLAHSRFSMEQSVALNRRAFERACLPLSPAVFTQEGQFSEGMLDVMKGAGQTIGIMKGGPFDYQYSSIPNRLLYTLRGQDVVTTRGMSDGTFSVTWWFVDDGELALTGEMNPYMGLAFQYSETAAKKLVQRLEQLQADGYFLTTVGDYVRRLKDAGVQAEPLPYSLDLNWRPDDADNFHAWMGRAGLWGPDEADNEVLASLERSRIALMAADTALTWADSEGLALDILALRAAWQDAMRLQVLGEVSDSTGWNPWAGEVRYSLERAALAMTSADEVLSAIQVASGGAFLWIDTRDGTVQTVHTAPLEQPDWQPADAPIEVEVNAPGFQVDTVWRRDPSAESPAVFECTVALTRSEAGSASATISFPRAGDRLIYSPAMLDEVADIALVDLPGHQDLVNVPAANGLVGLGNGVFVVKDLRTIHLSAFFPKAKPRVFFRDQTLNGPGPFAFRFVVLMGATADQALLAAQALNSTPRVVFP